MPPFWYLLSDSVPHFIPPFVTTQLRNHKPWKKLIERFVDTFFSKAVPCQMDEKIDDLEGHKRTPDAMGKDIFKVTGLQEAVRKLLKANPGLGVKQLLAMLREQQRNLGREAKEEKRKQRRADDKAKQQKNVESRIDPGNKEVAVAAVAQPAVAVAQPAAAAAVALAAASLTLTATHEALEAVKAEREAKAKKKEKKEADKKKKEADEKEAEAKKKKKANDAAAAITQPLAGPTAPKADELV